MSDQWGVGNKSDEEAFDTTKLGSDEVELIFGEHPHSRQDNRRYARTKSGAIYGFDGHRRLIDIQIKSSNYLKSSGLSGDEIRKEVIGKIFSDGQQVYEFFSRDPQDALLKAHRLIGKLSDVHGWLSAKNREKLIGRKIYYHDQPAVITGLIVEQGCIMVTTEPGFKPPEYTYDDNGMGEEHRQSWFDDYKEGDHYEIKTEVISDNIYWFR